MTLSRINHTGAAVVTGLTASITASSTSCTINSGTGWPTSNFVMKIDAGTPAEEKILCSSRSGTTVNFTTRGYDGTTATSHSAGTTNVEHDLAAVVVDDANDHIYTTTRDDHTQYARTDGTRPFSGNVTINGNLAVTGSSSCWARLYCSTAPGGGTSVQVTGNTGASGGTNPPTTSATGITITEAGLYLVTAQTVFSLPSGSADYSPSITVEQNGTAVRYFYNVATGTATGADIGAGGSDIISLAAADVLTYFANSGSGNSVNVQTGSTYTWLSAVKVA